MCFYRIITVVALIHLVLHVLFHLVYRSLASGQCQGRLNVALAYVRANGWRHALSKMVQPICRHGAADDVTGGCYGSKPVSLTYVVQVRKPAQQTGKVYQKGEPAQTHVPFHKLQHDDSPEKPLLARTEDDLKGFPGFPGNAKVLTARRIAAPAIKSCLACADSVSTCPDIFTLFLMLSHLS